MRFKAYGGVMKGFFWNGWASCKEGVHLVVWKSVCISRNEKGLGVKNLAIMNDAPLTKWW